MTSDDESVTERRAIHRYQCPICERVVCVSKPQEAPHRPFCSERCKMTDLGRWFGEVYRTSEPASPDDFADAQLDDDSGNSADDSIR